MITVFRIEMRKLFKQQKTWWSFLFMNMVAILLACIITFSQED